MSPCKIVGELFLCVSVYVGVEYFLDELCAWNGVEGLTHIYCG